MRLFRKVHRATFEPISLRAFDLVNRRRIRSDYFWLTKTQWWPRERILELQAAQLGRLLHHAYDYSPFYRLRLADIGWAPGEAVSLDLLRLVPTLEKTDLQVNSSEVSTAGRWNGGRSVRWFTGGSSSASPATSRRDRWKRTMC